MNQSYFDGMIPNPKRKLYSATICATYPKRRTDSICKADRLINEYTTYPSFLVIPQIIFPFDGNIEWLVAEFCRHEIPAIITEIKPQMFFCTNATPWLYVYEFHKANGYVYPLEAEVFAEKMYYNISKRYEKG